MYNDRFDDDYDARREKRMAKMRHRKRQQIRRKKIMLASTLAVIALVVVVVVVNLFGKEKDDKQASSDKVISENVMDTDEEIKDEDTEDTNTDKEEVTEEKDEENYFAQITKETTDQFPDVTCEYAVLIDKAENKIIAQKNYQERINPASMTKVLTILVAAENVEKLDDMCTVTIETTDYCYVNDCSNVGYQVGEQVTVKELFYGTILPSGADAALTLAEYVAGSHEEFVKMMNTKLKELGLNKTTHFTNCVGLYDEKHYSTAYDMAIILEAAMDNEFCREVLTTHIYSTEPTTQHPDGQTLSNLFLRRVEDQELGNVTVLGAKTGFVAQAGNCCVSSASTPDGKEYYLCTAKSSGAWPCIYDHAKIYEHFVSTQKKE